jgi:hypothetical protein
MNQPYDYSEELERLRERQGVIKEQNFASDDVIPSSRDVARASISKAVKSAEAAYWEVCDAEGKAIRPSTLGAPSGFLDDAYDLALEAELLVSDEGLSWEEARQRV